MLFQNTIENIDSEITALLAQVEAAKQRQTRLMELDALTDSTLGQLGDVVGKIGQVAPDALASLKLAVLGLFDSGDNENDGNGGGNQPLDPTPEPDDDSPELLCLNGLTGECLTTDDLDDEEFPVDDPIGNEWILPSDAPLTGQTCAIDPELYWEVTPPDGSSWEFASPLACGVWEDAPLTGQHCTVTLSPSAEEDKSTLEIEGITYIELVTHPENEALAYQRKHLGGEIVCCYIGFNAKARASSWQLFVETMTERVELRPATRMSAFRYELKIKGLSKTQIDRLAQEVDIKKSYHKPWNGEAKKPPTYKEPERFEAVNPDEVEPGDIVTPLLTPGDSYEVIQVMPNGILDCKSMRTGVQMGMRPGAVSLVQKAPKVEPKEQPVEAKGKAIAADKGFIETSGNYRGLTRQVKQRWEKAGIDPKELIADMRARRPAEPEWNAAKYNPVLIAMGDDASDF